MGHYVRCAKLRSVLLEGAGGIEGVGFASVDRSSGSGRSL